MTPETDADGVKVERFEMVDEFIARLTVADDFLSGSRFLFRGVPDATLPLLPSARREKPYPPFRPEPKNAGDQARYEMAALRRFYEAAHFEGLTIPGWPEVQAYVAGHKEQRANVREFIALAQHHGTPTTLLDWTIDPFVAAYFAASDIHEKHEDAKEMGVWWFDPSVKRHPSLTSPWTEIRIPFDVNQNARAQRAVFIDYQMSLPRESDPVARDSLIEVVKWRDDEHGGPRLINAFAKFTLPRTKAASLLSTLRSVRRISASTLFPGYYGVAREERERNQTGDL